jgi:dienelactone hydrolase
LLYPGDRHLFADASTADHDPVARAAMLKHVLSFLARTELGA